VLSARIVGVRKCWWWRGFEAVDDGEQVVGSALVHFDDAELTSLAGALDDAAGQFELFAMLGQEFGGGDEDGAGQAGFTGLVKVV
jgi:hypothetical protein